MSCVNENYDEYIKIQVLQTDIT